MEQYSLKYGKVRLFIVIVLVAMLSADVAFMPIGPVTFSAADLSILIMIALPLVVDRKDNLQFLRQNIPLFAMSGLFLFVGLLSALHSPDDTGYPYKALAHYFAMIAGSWQLAFLASQNKNSFYAILFFLSAALSLVAIPETYYKGLGDILAQLFRQGTSVHINGQLRPGATMGHANVFACFNAAAIFLGTYLYIRRLIDKRLYWVAMVLITIALSLGSSRNAYLAFLVGLLVLAAGREHRVLAGKILIVFCTMYLLFSPSLLRFGEVGDKSSIARTQLWEAALAMTMDYPVLGVGPGCYNRTVHKYASVKLEEYEGSNINKMALNAHNGILNILAEFGIAGASVLGLLLVLYFKKFSAMYRAIRGSALVAAACGLLLPFLLDAFFYSYFYMLIAGSVLLLLVQKPAEDSLST